MDSDSANVQDGSDCIHVTNESNLTGTRFGEGVTDLKGIDAVDSTSELAAPATVGEGEDAFSKPGAEISDVAEERTLADAELSQAVVEGGGEDADSMDLVGGGGGDVAEAHEGAALIVEEEEGDPAAERGDSLFVGGNMVKEEANMSDSVSENTVMVNKEVAMEEEEEEAPSHDLSASKVNEADTLKVEEKREEADDESRKVVESELVINAEFEKETVDAMEEETKVETATLEDIVSDMGIPSDNDIASVAGFSEISSQDKALDSSVLNSGSEFVEEETLKELHMDEGGKDMSDVVAKEDVGVAENVMDVQVLKETEEEEKLVSVSEIQTKPQEVEDVVNELSGNKEAPMGVGGSSAVEETVVDDVKEDVEKDPEVVKSVDLQVPEAAEDVETDVEYSAGIEKEDDGMGGMEEAVNTDDLEDNREISDEHVKVDKTKIAKVSEETETMIGNEEQEKDDDTTGFTENVETHRDSSVADIEEERKDHEEMAMKEMPETQEENATGDGTKIAVISEDTVTRTKDEHEKKDDDMIGLADGVETHVYSSVADIEEQKEDHAEMGIPEMTETQEGNAMGKVDGPKVAELSEDTVTRIKDEDEKKEDDMTDILEDVETHGDSLVGGIEEGKEDHEETGIKEITETQEEDVMDKVDRTTIAEIPEETETRVEDEDEEKDEDMTDVAEDVETQGDSSVADIEEGMENHENTEMATEMQEESLMAETGDEEPEEENKSVGGKRKRVRNTKTVKGTGKKKEEDVCFMCFDGGDLVLCDRRGCPKAYHPSCVNRDEAFFRSKGKWNCGWHLCSKCEKTATYLCYTCMFSLCKGCAKDAAFFCIRGNKGLCETCMETVKLIERKEQEKEPAQLDFDDKTSWEYLFKDYWINLKTQLSLSPEEIDQAKSPQKGHESHASKQGTASENDNASDGGSDSESSPKKRKTRSRAKSGTAKKILSPGKINSSGETVEWASKELLDVVAHMRHGNRSFLPHSEVHTLLLDYIKRYSLRDPRRKSQVICDSRLQNLFGKSHVGHFEMLNLLETHFLNKEQQQADDIQGSIVDTESDHVDVDENLDHPTKSGKDKKRKPRRKGARKGRQSNLDEFAAIDMHNINLIYLRRSLVEDLLGDTTTFEEKVASAFVRLRISGNQKQDVYRLVQVVGTSKAPEPYKVGKKTTDFVLQILNLDKTETISIDIISNQDFTEDECNRLKQSIKFGLINRLSVGDIQEKAIALQEVRVKSVLESEIQRFSHLRDRASDMGHRKEYPYLFKLSKCVEKLQLLKSPEEQQRRLEEIPEIHADPKMDPNCESEDEEGEAEKEKEKNLRSRSSSFNKRGRDPISPRKGGFSSNDSWTGTSNYSSTSVNRELSRSYSARGSTGRVDYPGSSDDKVSESMWTSGREREMQRSLGSELRSISIPETPARSSRAVVVPPELSPRIVPEVSPPTPSVVSQPVPKSNDSEKTWHYKDPSGKVQGPFSMAQLRKWNNTGYFPAKLEIWKANESSLDSILLTDALAGLFQKQPQSVDNSYPKPQVAAYSGNSSQSELNVGSTARTAPSILDIPRNSQDTWSSGGGSLPSPTPNQIATPTAKRRSFESRWSPTKPPAQSTIQSVQVQASRTDIPVIVNSAGVMQLGTHPKPTQESSNITVNHYGSVAALPSPTPAGGKQGWGHGGVDAPSSAQNSYASYGTVTPSVLPSQSQQGFPSSDSWRAPVPSQPNTQAHAPVNNLQQWGMNTVSNSQISGQQQPQVPVNQNSGWGQGTVNPNMGWAGPVQAGTNVNWAASSVPQPGQVMPNTGWGGPVQGQPQAYQNAGWGVTGQPQAQVQAPGSSMGSGWMQPGQGMQSGNSNQSWGTQNQTAIPSGGPGGNQACLWSNQQQDQNGDSGYGWNRQSSGGGSFKGQRVCKFFREDGYCRKGASCTFLHN
ncbi:unnamed protein product [Cochlearia groenlandica]